MSIVQSFVPLSIEFGGDRKSLGKYYTAKLVMPYLFSSLICPKVKSPTAKVQRSNNKRTNKRRQGIPFEIDEIN